MKRIIENESVKHLVTKHFVRHLLNGFYDMPESNISGSAMSDIVNEANRMYINSWDAVVKTIDTDKHLNLNSTGYASNAYLQPYYLFASENNKLTEFEAHMLDRINWDNFNYQKFAAICNNSRLIDYLEASDYIDNELTQIIKTANNRHLPDWNNKTVNNLRNQHLLIHNLVDVTAKCYDEIQKPTRNFNTPYLSYEKQVTTQLNNKLKNAYAIELNMWNACLASNQVKVWHYKLNHSNRYFVTNINAHKIQTLIDSVEDISMRLAKEYCDEKYHMTKYLNFETALKYLNCNKKLPKYVINYFNMLDKLEHELYQCSIIK